MEQMGNIKINKLNLQSICYRVVKSFILELEQVASNVFKTELSPCLSQHWVTAFTTGQLLDSV